MAWAGVCEDRGRIPEAIRAYETAMRVEPNMAGPRTNLASIMDELARRGDPRAAQRASELRRDEMPLLARDANLAPGNAAVQYRYGLALYLAGDLNAALDRLRQAAELAPDVEEYALAVKLMREEIEKRSAAP
jgi:tetratricopeptide (TPR) repeat protein